MFLKFTRELPNYGKQVELTRERAQKTEWRASHLRLMKALSQVYIDMLQFCLEASRIFSKKGHSKSLKEKLLFRRVISDNRKGVWRGASVVFSLAWTPFNRRFEDIIFRLRENQAVFNLCVASILNEEALKHYDKMDEERLANRRERIIQAEDSERHNMGMILRSGITL